MGAVVVAWNGTAPAWVLVTQKLEALCLELGISKREHEALESVLAGNRVIPEATARGLRAGDHLERYRVTGSLGQGWQGVVVRAEDSSG